MRVLLIDADSKIPNLAIMKLSQYFKKIAKIDFIKLNMPYFSTGFLKKKKVYIYTKPYDKIFCSVIFKNNFQNIIGENIEFGGTGYDVTKKLDKKIEDLPPDYTIYPENNILYDFITRGCIRNCYFCFVPKKEGNLYLYKSIDEILKTKLKYKSIEFMDNNFLGYKHHKAVLKEIISKKLLCSFNQGLDIRLIDKENSELLRKLRYNGAYKFAFDDWSLKKTIEQKLDLLKWRRPYQFLFYMYFNPKMDLENINNRIKWAKKNQILPYVMRDLSCWENKRIQPYLSDLIQWTNCPMYFTTQTIDQCIHRFRKNKRRSEITLKIFESNKFLPYSNEVQMNLFNLDKPGRESNLR